MANQQPLVLSTFSHIGLTRVVYRFLEAPAVTPELVDFCKREMFGYDQVSYSTCIQGKVLVVTVVSRALEQCLQGVGAEVLRQFLDRLQGQVKVVEVGGSRVVLHVSPGEPGPEAIARRVWVAEKVSSLRLLLFSLPLIAAFSPCKTTTFRELELREHEHLALRSDPDGLLVAVDLHFPSLISKSNTSILLTVMRMVITGLAERLKVHTGKGQWRVVPEVGVLLGRFEFVFFLFVNSQCNQNLGSSLSKYHTFKDGIQCFISIEFFPFWLFSRSSGPFAQRSDVEGSAHFGWVLVLFRRGDFSPDEAEALALSVVGLRSELLALHSSAVVSMASDLRRSSKELTLHW
jgi:hypothetical protein